MFGCLQIFQAHTDREVQENLRFQVPGGRRGRERRITQLEVFWGGRDGAER